MSDDDLIREIKSALDDASPEDLDIVKIPTAWGRAQDALRHGQFLIRVPNDPGPALVAVSGHCVLTGYEWRTSAYVESELLKGIRLWDAGSLIQCALHFLSASEREFLMSGISPAGWKFVDAGEENDEEPGDREPFFPPSL